MNRSKRYSPEIRERAVRMVFEHQRGYGSGWAAMCLISNKNGCTAETLRKWVRRAGYDTGEMLEPGTSINPTEGPCANMGTSQIFGKDENEDLFSDFSDRQIRLSPVVNQKTDKRVIEWLVWAQK